jgi:hypothetical protein
MYGSAILVLGAKMQTAAIADALHGYDAQTWTDEPASAFEDGASLGWADALVVVDTTSDLTLGREPAIRSFDGPRLLVTSVPLSYPQIEALMNEGYDAVLQWPAATEVIAARAARLVRAMRQTVVAASRMQHRASA